MPTLQWLWSRSITDVQLNRKIMQSTTNQLTKTTEMDVPKTGLPVTIITGFLGSGNDTA
jgi:hypothetical protein